MARKRTVLQRFVAKLYLDVAEMRWRVLAIGTVLHAAASWALLHFSGEEALTGFSTFVYFYMTTSTTVGYGDFSPVTDTGRWITIFFVMTGGIALFTSVIAKSIAKIANYWRRAMEGRGSYEHLDGATVIIGHHPNRTKRMIEEVFSGNEDERDLVLLTLKNIAEPDPRVRYVQSPSLTTEEALRRAGVARAERVIVYADTDELTLTAALAVSAMNPSAHLVAYFADEQSARLLKLHSHAECVVSLAVEMVVRAMQDPGASQVMASLSSSTERGTIFSVHMPDGAAATYRQAAEYLADEKQANLIAVRAKGEEKPRFIPDRAERLGAGAQLYFIADKRLCEADIDWRAMGAPA